MQKILVMTALLCFPSLVIASESFSENCQRKAHAIEQKLAFARAQGNEGQISGLEKALGQVQRWCSDESLHSKAELRIMEKQDEVQERREALDEALAKGKDRDKIKKLQRKLNEAEEELREAITERDALL